MWILRVRIDTDRYGADLEYTTLSYVGNDTSIEVLFNLLKRQYPDCMFTLGSMLDGSNRLPHSGNSYPYWFTKSGLTHRLHNLEFLTKREAEFLNREIRETYEEPSWKHTQDHPEPPDDVQLIDMEDDIPI